MTLTVLGKEPVAWTALISAMVTCVTAFGFDLTADQVAAIMLVTNAILAVVARQSVTPAE